MPKSQHAVHMAVQKRWTQPDVRLKPVLKMDADQVYKSRVRTEYKAGSKDEVETRGQNVFSRYLVL